MQNMQKTVTTIVQKRLEPFIKIVQFSYFPILSFKMQIYNVHLLFYKYLLIMYTLNVVNSYYFAGMLYNGINHDI